MEVKGDEIRMKITVKDEMGRGITNENNKAGK